MLIYKKYSNIFTAYTLEFYRFNSSGFLVGTKILTYLLIVMLEVAENKSPFHVLCPPLPHLVGK
jgi:hypothetical protein